MSFAKHGALRATQHFGPFNVEQLSTLGAGNAQIDFINVDRDRLLIDIVGFSLYTGSSNEIARKQTVFTQFQAWNIIGQFRSILDTKRPHFITRQGRQ